MGNAEPLMAGSSFSGRPRPWLVLTRGSARRRRAILIALLAGLAVSVVLTPFTLALGWSLAAIFIVALGLDVVLLRRRRVLLAEQTMSAAFRARRPTRHPPLR